MIVHELLYSIKKRIQSKKTRNVGSYWYWLLLDVGQQEVCFTLIHYVISMRYFQNGKLNKKLEETH